VVLVGGVRGSGCGRDEELAIAGMGDMYLRFWWEEWEGVGVEGMQL
jgi:hypothetical protein